MNTLKHLIIKELKSEFREKNALHAILLYVVSSGFICFLAFRNIVQPQVWNALYWIILLFNSINTVSKSFLNENHQRYIYYYSLYTPRDFVLAKIIYNGVLSVVTALLTFFIVILFLGNKIENIGLFLLIIIFSSFTLASILSLVSAIAGRASGNITLVSILSFPLTVPLLLVSIRVTKNAIDNLAWSVSYMPILSLLAIFVICITLSLLLFPYLWRD